MCAHGTPSQVRSDRGEQLVAAAGQVQQWDFSGILEWCAGKRTEWVLVPTGGQHMNGQAERLIGLGKRMLMDVLKEKMCTYSELITILQEVAVMVNSRLIGIQGRQEDLEAGGAITPLHLLVGRATLAAPRETFSGPAKLTRRLSFLREIKNQFWRKWRSLVFQGLVYAWKWRPISRNLKVGDVVLLMKETVTAADYKLGRVYRAIACAEDGLVRKVVVGYHTHHQAPLRFTERPINKLVLVVPVEEQEDANEAGRLELPPGARVESSIPSPDAMGEGVKEDEAAQEEGEAAALPVTWLELPLQVDKIV